MQPFTLFNSTHIISIVSTYLIIAMILVWVSYQSKPIKKNAEVSIGVLLITHYFMQFFHALSFELSWQEIIPLHMCDFSKLSIGLYLLGYGKRYFHCAFFWGIIPVIIVHSSLDILIKPANKLFAGNHNHLFHLIYFILLKFA